MKIFSSGTRRPLNRSEAWSCALINQLATPGLGTLIARRFVSGGLQLILATIGFIMIMGWLIRVLLVFYGQMFGTSGPAELPHKIGWIGAALFAIAWIWSLISSIQIIRNAPEHSAPLPPVIRDG